MVVWYLTSFVQETPGGLVGLLFSFDGIVDIDYVSGFLSPLDLKPK